jgi:hypothetical protein
MFLGLMLISRIIKDGLLFIMLVGGLKGGLKGNTMELL